MPEYLHPFIVVRRCYTAICRPGKASIFKVGIIIADLVQEFVARDIQKWNQFLTSKLCLLATETVFQSEISLSFESFKLQVPAFTVIRHTICELDYFHVFVTEASELGRQILDSTFALICSIDHGLLKLNIVLLQTHNCIYDEQKQTEFVSHNQKLHSRNLPYSSRHQHQRQNGVFLSHMTEHCSFSISSMVVTLIIKSIGASFLLLMLPACRSQSARPYGAAAAPAKHRAAGGRQWTTQCVKLWKGR